MMERNRRCLALLGTQAFASFGFGQLTESSHVTYACHHLCCRDEGDKRVLPGPALAIRTPLLNVPQLVVMAVFRLTLLFGACSGITTSVLPCSVL